MAKKIFISFAIIILSVCTTVCFAADNNSNVNLGEEITDSLDKTGDSVRNVADDVMDGVDNITRDNRDDNATNNNNRNENRDNNRADNRNNNEDDNMFTEGYDAVRTSVDEMTTGTMSTTTWIWIILAVAAIIIVAMVWYYAVQDRRD